MQAKLDEIVRVVVPVRDDPRGLARLIDSMARLDDRPALTVVDDGSEEPAATRAVVDAAPMAIDLRRSDRNVGPAAARNLGVSPDETRHLAFVDADDELIAGWDRWARQMVEAGTDLAFCSALWVRLESGTQRVSLAREVPLMDGGPVNFLAGAYLVSADAFHGVGGFVPELRQGENHELGIRLAAAVGPERRAWTRQSLVQVHPSPVRGRARAPHRLAATEYLLEAHRERLANDRASATNLHRVAAVNAQRCGDVPLARRHLRAAVSLGDRSSIMRYAFACLGPIARRYYGRR